jgi:hypothetical protein
MTAPTQRAVDAAAEALRHGDHRFDYAGDAERLARLAIHAAYPHLVGTLSDENGVLRVVANEKYAEAAEWRDIADELVEALKESAGFEDLTHDEVVRLHAALARYDKAAQ